VVGATAQIEKNSSQQHGIHGMQHGLAPSLHPWVFQLSNVYMFFDHHGQEQSAQKRSALAARVIRQRRVETRNSPDRTK